MKKNPQKAPDNVDEDSGQTHRIVEATRYLDQCWEERSRFGVLISEQSDAISIVLRHFTENLPEATRLARTPAPTDSSHAFLESALSQFGFDPFDASAEDLQRLLTVVIRQGSEHVGGSVILVEDAQLFGPRVWETIRDVTLHTRDSLSPLLFVLAGNAALHRVLDSTGMSGVADLTRSRFDLDSGASVSPTGGGVPAPSPAAEAALLLSRDNQLIGRVSLDRDRVLIGRSEDSDVRLPSRFVSRQHALLLRNADGDWLVDLKSTNGTIVNSALVERRRLRPGDLISIGNFRLQYESRAPYQGRTMMQTGDSEDFTETVVMRSLKALHEPKKPAAPARKKQAKPGASSAA